MNLAPSLQPREPHSFHQPLSTCSPPLPLHAIDLVWPRSHMTPYCISMGPSQPFSFHYSPWHLMLLTAPSFWKIYLANLDLGGLNPTEVGAQVHGWQVWSSERTWGWRCRKFFSLWKALSWLPFALRPESILGRAGRGAPRSSGWESWKSQGIQPSRGPSKKSSPNPKKGGSNRLSTSKGPRARTPVQGFPAHF